MEWVGPPWTTSDCYWTALRLILLSFITLLLFAGIIIVLTLFIVEEKSYYTTISWLLVPYVELLTNLLIVWIVALGAVLFISGAGESNCWFIIVEQPPPTTLLEFVLTDSWELLKFISPMAPLDYYYFSGDYIRWVPANPGIPTTFCIIMCWGMKALEEAETAALCESMDSEPPIP